MFAALSADHDATITDLLSPAGPVPGIPPHTSAHGSPYDGLTQAVLQQPQDIMQVRHTDRHIQGQAAHGALLLQACNVPTFRRLHTDCIKCT